MKLYHRKVFYCLFNMFAPVARNPFCGTTKATARRASPHEMRLSRNKLNLLPFTAHSVLVFIKCLTAITGAMKWFILIKYLSPIAR